MRYCNFLVRVDFLPILISESPDDGCYSVPAQMWLYSLPSLPHCSTMVDHMINQSGSDLIRDYGLGLPRPCPPRPPPLTLTPLALSSVSNVGIHCSKTEELTCCPFMLKLWLLIVKRCDGCLPLWWVSVHIWMAVCSLWKQDIFCMKIVPKAENCV